MIAGERNIQAARAFAHATTRLPSDGGPRPRCRPARIRITLSHKEIEMSTSIRNVRFSIVGIIVGVAVIPAAVLGLLFLAERIYRWHFYPGI